MFEYNITNMNNFANFVGYLESKEYLYSYAVYAILNAVERRQLASIALNAFGVLPSAGNRSNWLYDRTM